MYLRDEILTGPPVVPEKAGGIYSGPAFFYFQGRGWFFLVSPTRLDRVDLPGLSPSSVNDVS